MVLCGSAGWYGMVPLRGVPWFRYLVYHGSTAQYAVVPLPGTHALVLVPGMQWFHCLELRSVISLPGTPLFVHHSFTPWYTVTSICF